MPNTVEGRRLWADWLGHGLVEHGFHVVAVGTNDECCKVAP